MKKYEFENFKISMDSWIKEIQSKLTEYNELPEIVSENLQNTDHNYELIKDLRAEVNRLKEELCAMRLIQIMHLEHDVGKISEVLKH